MSGISTHVLDTGSGRPASGIRVRLFMAEEEIGSGITNQDGRVPSLVPDRVNLKAGIYRIAFEVADYFPQGFYPEVLITFSIRDDASHYHVPLLISAFGYTTYRGS